MFESIYSQTIFLISRGESFLKILVCSGAFVSFQEKTIHRKILKKSSKYSKKNQKVIYFFIIIFNTS